MGLNLCSVFILSMLLVLELASSNLLHTLPTLFTLERTTSKSKDIMGISILQNLASMLKVWIHFRMEGALKIYIYVLVKRSLSEK